LYNTLHHGFLETIYARALEQVLRRGHTVAREVRVPVWFENKVLGYHRLDMLVDKKVVVEIKSAEKLPEMAERQLRSYLKARQLSLGLILHFGTKARVRRVDRLSFTERHGADDPIHPGQSQPSALPELD
jgi:GxxExxY protein